MNRLWVGALIVASGCGAGQPTTGPAARTSETAPVLAWVSDVTAPAIADQAAVRVTTVPESTVPATTTTVPAAPDPVPGPGGTTGPGRCTQYEPLLEALAPVGGWSVGRMSGYMWRESNCTPWVRSRTQDTGLPQINDVNLPYLTQQLGTAVTQETLKDPTLNVRAAAALCTYWRNAGRSCYHPWGGAG